MRLAFEKTEHRQRTSASLKESLEVIEGAIGVGGAGKVLPEIANQVFDEADGYAELGDVLQVSVSAGEVSKAATDEPRFRPIQMVEKILYRNQGLGHLASSEENYGMPTRHVFSIGP